GPPAPGEVTRAASALPVKFIAAALPGGRWMMECDRMNNRGLPTRAELALAYVLAVLTLALAARLCLDGRLCPAGDVGDLARPIDLYELTVEEARRLHGYRVEVFLELGCPADVGDGYTAAGCYERDDGVERAVYLMGERHDLGAGDRLIVSGTLRVVQHRDAT